MEKVALWAQLYQYCMTKYAAEEKSMQKILSHLSELETFKERIDYAEKELKHLSSGSSRVIYVMPDGNVLKLAKNKKGLAQNKAESNPEIKSKYINKTLKSNIGGVWKVSPYLEKITEKEFEKLTGIGFKDFGEAIGYGLRSVSDNSGEAKPTELEGVFKSDIYKELVEVGKKHSLMPGDIERISSWGRKGDDPVLLDTGLTKQIFDKFYED